ncbi:MAG: thiaminase II [Pseudomonadota bacterium]
MSELGSSYGAVFQAWRDASPDWDGYTQHAFVEGLRDGSLPRSAFLHYLVQDYVFLVHFSRAWALGVVKAETQEEMQTCAGTVDALVNHEMRLHVGTCAEEGISEDQLFHAAEEAENLAYTRYVLEAGYSGDYLDLMAALMPCVMGYGEIGARLGADNGETQYQPWIDTYSGADYQSMCTAVGAMVDAAVDRRLGSDFRSSPRWASLSAKFATATKLEVGFWGMGMRGA